MGVSTRELGKMLENGEVLAEDLLPKLAIELQSTFAGEAKRAASSLSAEIERLKTEVFEYLRQADEATGITDLFGEAVGAAGSVFKSANARPLTEELEQLRENAESADEKLKEMLDLQDPSGIFMNLIDTLGLTEQRADAVDRQVVRWQESMNSLVEFVRANRQELITLGIDPNELNRILGLVVAIKGAGEQGAPGGLFPSGGLGPAPESITGPLFEDFIPSEVPDSLKELRSELKLLGAPDLVRDLAELDLRLADIVQDIKELEKPETLTAAEFEVFKTNKIIEATALIQDLRDELIMLGFNAMAADVGASIPPDARDKMQATRDDMKELGEEFNGNVPRINKLRAEIDEMGISMAGVLAAGVNKTTERMDKFGDTIDDLTLKEANEGLDEMHKAFEKAGNSGKTAAEKIQEAIDKQILINANLRKQIGAEDEVVEQLKIELKVRQQNAGAPEPLIDRLIDLLNVERDITKEIERQISRREAAARAFENLGKSTGPDARDKLGPSRGRENVFASNERQTAVTDQRAALRDEIIAMGQANEIVALRIRGERELADQLETRFELAKKFPDLNETELKQLEAVMNANKRLNNVLKEQEEMLKVRKELAQDFASAIGTAFEDAIIEGEKLSNVLQALLEDIQRIILRVLVTKPLENFLTGVLTGEDPTGSKAGPGGTPFFGGILGDLFSSGGSKETATGGRTGRAGGVGTAGVGGGFAAATEIEKLAVAAKTAGGSMEGPLAGGILETVSATVLEKATTTTLTASLFELKVAAIAAANALQAIAVAGAAGAGGGGSMPPFIPTSLSGAPASILNFGGSFGGDAGLPFGGQPPPFVSGFGFVGARQHGGPTGPNSPVLVGEAGPEVFIPNRAGRIEPMPRGERPIIVNQTMNVKSEDDMGFRRSARSNLRLLGRSAKSSLRAV
jgi:hypothetical protein